jgi:WD40 repeat protein
LEGNVLVQLTGHEGDISTAMFSPDGKYIVTASRDMTAIIWPTPETIIDWLKTAPIPKLTPEEKKELGIEGFKID